MNADALLRAMGDELIEYGDPEVVMRRMIHQGLEVDGQRLQGLREVLDRLRQARSERLERDDLGGVFAEVEDALRHVVKTERAVIDEQAEESAATKREYLDLLDYETLAGRVRGLQNHEFVSGEAEQYFEELLDRLRDQLTQQFVDRIADSAGSVKPDDRARMIEMLSGLNAMLRARQLGVDPADEARIFDDFVERFRDFFPKTPQNLDEWLEVMAGRMTLMAQVMNSMSSEQRIQLQELSDQLLEDLDLQWEASQLGEALRDLFPKMGWDNSQDFRGDQLISMDEAMEAIDAIAELDQLEQLLRGANSPGALAEIDIDRVRDLLDDESADSLERLANMAELLSEAGLIEKTEGRLQLTPRAVRRLGQNALGDLYRRLSRDRAGRHDQKHDGSGHEREYTTRVWEFGDPFDLDIEATVRNAVARTGRGTPVSLSVEDFAVERTESEVQASTVLMLDLSLSMPMKGNFLPAKKTAMALHQLMASQYPRDYLGVVTFSEVAREIQPERLPEVSWDYVYGTNMQHGFALARKMLAGQSGNRQIIMVTDGEPTAHLTDDGLPLFNYPPTRETVDRTLREVRRCTREDIRINVFMLDATPHLTRFIEQVTRLNGGRAFMTDNRELGNYVLIDFVEHRRMARSRR
ncbi:MAG: hypothetical protein P8M16_03445 [Acidimicrobiales bacterium]|nr:hypothetical protein [Acidimicrobiales bacterium]